MEYVRKNIVHLDDHSSYTNGVFNTIDPKQNKYFFQAFKHPDEAFNYIITSLATDARIDLIIADINHPGKQGLDFASDVKALTESYGIKIPFMILSMMVPAPINHQNKKEFMLIKGELEKKHEKYPALIRRFLEYLDNGCVQSFLGKDSSPEKIVLEMERLFKYR